MEAIEYKKLYEIQDIVIESISKIETEFYLTGGTCLCRFYWNKRYSIDLDFFTNYSNSFHQSIREIEDHFDKDGIVHQRITESKDFVRLMIDDYLQIDFINDRVKYFGKNEIVNGLKIDNWENILANKVTAVIARDNVKDIFDIFLVSKHKQFKWSDVIEKAKEKMTFDDSELCERLMLFPKVMINRIDVCDFGFLENFEKEFNLIINDICHKKENSLCQIVK
ncbi:MAG: nucleotidyl transferase AbiEii/AbiGii toxin family protein [Candidatus Cloacimonetes bacterium]|nr:nucleotidyl transferase AbiEii/AbiGii toxin family protein [Candidatus Cloacimonadota bacterium]